MPTAIAALARVQTNATGRKGSAIFQIPAPPPPAWREGADRAPAPMYRHRAKRLLPRHYRADPAPRFADAARPWRKRAAATDRRRRTPNTARSEQAMRG